MKYENFILHEHFNKVLSNEMFDEAKKAYLNSLEIYKYAIKDANDIYELIDKIKRTPEKVGPYQNISVFEALNRIGSDLVLLAGATELFKVETEIRAEKIELKMGNTHGFDFEVQLPNGKVIYGEAFNAAESFCKSKMRDAIHKLIDKNPDSFADEGIVFINEEVRPTIEKYINKKELDSKIKIHRIYCSKLK